MECRPVDYVRSCITIPLVEGMITCTQVAVAVAKRRLPVRSYWAGSLQTCFAEWSTVFCSHCRQTSPLLPQYLMMRLTNQGDAESL